MNDTIHLIANDLDALSSRWASDRSYMGSPVDDVREIVERLRALSARASAGEGGDGQGEHAYNCGVNDAIVHDCSCGLAAAPQPAQAGASGGGYCEAHGKAATESLVKYACGCSVHESGDGRNTIATPASPATFGGSDAQD